MVAKKQDVIDADLTDKITSSREKADLDALRGADISEGDKLIFAARVFLKMRYEDIADRFDCGVRSIKESLSRTSEAIERWKKWKQKCQAKRKEGTHNPHRK